MILPSNSFREDSLLEVIAQPLRGQAGSLHGIRRDYSPVYRARSASAHRTFAGFHSVARRSAGATTERQAKAFHRQSIRSGGLTIVDDLPGASGPSQGWGLRCRANLRACAPDCFQEQRQAVRLVFPRPCRAYIRCTAGSGYWLPALHSSLALLRIFPFRRMQTQYSRSCVAFGIPILLVWLYGVLIVGAQIVGSRTSGERGFVEVNGIELALDFDLRVGMRVGKLPEGNSR